MKKIDVYLYLFLIDAGELGAALGDCCMVGIRVNLYCSLISLKK